jgi:cytidine deaminase
MKDKLIKAAIRAKDNAYAPYSKFHVGAALLTSDDEIILGANVENASYSLTMCAERLAVFKGIFEGKKSFKAVAIAGNTDEPLPPCGACRQVLAELCGLELQVIMISKTGETKELKMKELLPYSFESKQLNVDEN